MQRLNLKIGTFVRVVLLLVVVVELNFLAREHLGERRVDLTSARRWTLTDATAHSLKEMQARYQETLRLDQDALGRPLVEAEKDDLRVHLHLYISADPPASVVERFRETEQRIDDLAAAAGDFLQVEKHRLDPERSRLEIQRAEQEGLSALETQGFLDEKGRTEELWCGLVLRYAEKRERVPNALAPFDVEAWFVRQIDAFREAEPALVCVLASQELRRTALGQSGFQELRSFQQDLLAWIRKQYPEVFQSANGVPDQARIQEANREFARLNDQHAPEVLAKDLRALLRGATTVRVLTRLDSFQRLPDDCRLLILMQPDAELLGEDGVDQIASYLRGGGNVLALVTRYAIQRSQNGGIAKQAVELGELGNYLETLGIRVRPEIVAQQEACVRLSQEGGEDAEAVGRRAARSRSYPFLLRLDVEDRGLSGGGAAVEIALLRAQRDALLELAKAAKAETDDETRTLVGDLSTTITAWGAVWEAEERGAQAIEDEQGLWPLATTQLSLEGLRRRLALAREEQELAEEALEAARLALQDVEAQIASGGAKTPVETLEREREALVADIAERDARAAAAAARIATGEALHRAVNFLRKGYSVWRQRFELSGEIQRQDETSRRAFVRTLRALLATLEEGGIPDPAAQDALDTWLSSFDLLYSFDAFRGGAQEVVDAIVAAGLEGGDADLAGEKLLRGPRSVVEGLTAAFLPWAHPIQLDPERIAVLDGSTPNAEEGNAGLHAVVVARSTADARYVRDPDPMGSLRYYQSLGIFAQASASPEKAMMLEAMDPEKRADDLAGSMPLVVAVEGEFPAFERKGRALLDGLRRWTSPPWFGGPLALDDDVDAPSFDPDTGWKRSEAGAAWTVEDLASAAREFSAREDEPSRPRVEGDVIRSGAAGSKDAEAEKATAVRPGRLVLVPNVEFAKGIGVELANVASGGRSLSSPFLARLLEWSLLGSEERYRSFDERRREDRRKLTNFQERFTKESAQHRATELWRDRLLAAAASSTFFEGEAEDRDSQESGGLGIKIGNDPMGQALDRLLSGDPEARQGDAEADDPDRGLDGVVLAIRDDIVQEAEDRESFYKLIGILLAPAAIFALMILTLGFAWIRYR